MEEDLRVGIRRKAKGGKKGDRVRGGNMGEGLGVGIKVRVKDEKSAGQYKGG